LETLVLADNGLTEISERVGDLRKLRMLDLGHNKLRQIPPSLGHLDQLSDFLYLHDNQLSTLPPPLGRLDRLRYLNISENAFDALPEAITAMTGLIELRVTDNRLPAFRRRSRDWYDFASCICATTSFRRCLTPWVRWSSFANSTSGAIRSRTCPTAF
jgi:hypothetical protein